MSRLEPPVKKAKLETRLTMEEEEALEADEEDERNELSALEQEQACTFLRVAASKHSRNL